MKDYLGNELRVGDEVIFIWPDCTFLKGRVECLYNESECGCVKVNFGGNLYTKYSNQCIKVNLRKEIIMTNLAPRDYFGRELCVGDTVVFSPIESADLIEGIIKEIDTEDEKLLVIETEKPYGNVYVWGRYSNRVIKKLNTKQKQEKVKNTSSLLRVYTMYDKFVEYKDASCEVKEFKDKLFLCVYSNFDNSILALWNMDSIYGYSFEEDSNET